MKRLFLSLVLITGLAGCNLDLKIEPTSKPINPESQKIADSMSTWSKEEKEIVYKQYTGLAELVKNTNSIKSTVEVEKLFRSFNEIYNYKPKSQVITDYLVSKKYEDPVLLEGEKRAKFIEDILVIADGAKIALEKK